jgi:hypothetical protein
VERVEQQQGIRQRKAKKKIAPWHKFLFDGRISTRPTAFKPHFIYDLDVLLKIGGWVKNHLSQFPNWMTW